MTVFSSFISVAFSALIVSLGSKRTDLGASGRWSSSLIHPGAAAGQSEPSQLGHVRKARSRGHKRVPRPRNRAPLPRPGSPASEHATWRGERGARHRHTATRQPRWPTWRKETKSRSAAVEPGAARRAKHGAAALFLDVGRCPRQAFLARLPAGPAFGRAGDSRRRGHHRVPSLLCEPLFATF